MIPARTQPPQAQAKPKESIPHRLARLRSEQTPRSRFTSSRTHLATSRQPVAAWLRPSSSQHEAGPGSRTTRASGPPPPASWSSQAVEHRAVLPTPVASRMKQRRLVERRTLAEPLVVDSSRSTSRGGGGSSVDSLFYLAGETLARDLALGSNDSLLLGHIAYLPAHIKMRLLDEVMANWRNEIGLTNSGAKELLRTDWEADDDRDEGRLGQEEEGQEGSWDSESRQSDGASANALRFDVDDAFSTPLSTALTSLNLSFSSVHLKSLRHILLRPASPASGASTSVTKLVPNFPHLHALVLCSTRNIPVLHDHFFSLLTSLLSLRTLSLAGNRVEPLESSEASCCSPKLFLPRLAASTPLLRQIDLSYMDGSADDGTADTFDFRLQVARRIDWATRWADLKVLGLRAHKEIERGLITSTLEADDRGNLEVVKKEIRDSIAQKRTRNKWIDVIV